MKTCATLFSGIGGSEMGLIAAGYKPLWGVEWNQGAIDILNLNYPSTNFICQDVTTVDFDSLPAVDLLWASPVCCNFSLAKHSRKETELDRESGKAIVRAANRSQSVIIENVPAYQDSQSYQLLKSDLLSLGLVYNKELFFNAADYFNPSHRTRFYSVFSRHHQIQDPNTQTSHQNWFARMVDCVNYWERSTLTRKQMDSIEAAGLSTTYPHEPFAIERCGYYGSPKIIKPSQIFPCIKSHPGHDGKNPKVGYGKIGSYRRQYDIVHEGSSYNISPIMFGVLMGFPKDYKWGTSKAHAVAGIGNAVVPSMAMLVANLLS